MMKKETIYLCFGFQRKEVFNMLKRMTAMLLLLTMCICAVSCGKKDDGIPDGMKLASAEGEPFRMYVPSSWTLNTNSGISGACLYYTTEIISAFATARFETLTEEIDLISYTNKRSQAYLNTVEQFHLISCNDAVLSGENARQMDYTATINGQAMTCREIIAFYKGDAVSLHLYASTERYNNVIESLTQIQENFVLCDKQIRNDAVTDKKTPDGMKIASDDDIEYRLYVPQTWICDSESGKSEAYVAEDRSNVTVSSYAPAVSMSVSDYFAMSEKSYKESLSGYTLQGQEARQVAERSATSYTYTAQYDGVVYRIRQTIFAYNEIIYSITYTAKDDCFEAHLADADWILDSFRFR